MKFSWQWRVMAVVALLAFVGSAALLLKVAISSFALLVLTLLTLLGLAYASWRLFTGRPRSYLGWLLLGLSALLLIIEIIVLLARGHNLGLLLVAAGLAALYLAVVRALRREYWKQERALAERASASKRGKHPVLIMNPKSGDGRAIKAHIDKLAPKQGIEVVITKKGDSIQGLAEQAVKRGADVLGVSGGDGTLGAVAKVALKHNLPLVVLPGGTRCHFARDLGLEPERIVDALAGFWGVERAVTVGLINDRLFLNNASFGVYADIVDHDEYRDHKVATSRTVLQEVLSGKRPGYELTFTDNGGKQHDRAVQILIGVNPYQTLKLLELGRRPKLDTGKLQVIAVTGLDPATIRGLLGAVALPTGTGMKLPENMLLWTTEEFVVTSQHDELVVGVDGEREEYDTPVRMSVAPKKLRLLVPAEGVRSRAKSAASSDVLRQLWHAMLGKPISPR